MPEPDFIVSHMTVLRQPIRLENQTIVAHMTVEYGALRIAGINFAVMDSGHLRVWMPRFGRGRISYLDRDARDELTRLAHNSYRTLAGRDPAASPLAKASSTDEVPS